MYCILSHYVLLNCIYIYTMIQWYYHDRAGLGDSSKLLSYWLHLERSGMHDKSWHRLLHQQFCISIGRLCGHIAWSILRQNDVACHCKNMLPVQVARLLPVLQAASDSDQSSFEPAAFIAKDMHKLHQTFAQKNPCRFKTLPWLHYTGARKPGRPLCGPQCWRDLHEGYCTCLGLWERLKRRSETRHVFVGATLGYLGAIHNPPASENPCHLSGTLPGTSKSQLGKLLPRRLVSRKVDMQNAACGSSKEAGNSAGSGSTSSPGNIAIPKQRLSSLLKWPTYPQRINNISRCCKQAVKINDFCVPPSSCIWDSKSCLKVNKASRRNEHMEIIGIGWLLFYRPSIISTWLDLVTKTHDHINVQGRPCKIWLQATPFRKS